MLKTKCFYVVLRAELMRYDHLSFSQQKCRFVTWNHFELWHISCSQHRVTSFEQGYHSERLELIDFYL